MGNTNWRKILRTVTTHTFFSPCLRGNSYTFYIRFYNVQRLIKRKYFITEVAHTCPKWWGHEQIRFTLPTTTTREDFQPCLNVQILKVHVLCYTMLFFMTTLA